MCSSDLGIALAMAMAFLDSDDIPHPPLEVIFTIDEETGMGGAAAIDMSLFKGNMLIIWIPKKKESLQRDVPVESIIRIIFRLRRKVFQ